MRKSSRLPIKVPPRELRSLVGNAGDLNEYLVVGHRSAQSLQTFLRRYGLEIQEFGSILDFACGCGRTLNFLQYALTDQQRLSGCDCDSELVKWCAENLTGLRSVANRKRPPIELDGSQFDLIYSISFFSHLGSQAQIQWLQEFRRLLRPDGFLILSLHGRKLAESEGIRLPSSGYLHQVMRGGAFNTQVTYQTRDSLEALSQGIMRILAYEELGLLMHQDLVLLSPEGTLMGRKPNPPSAIPRALINVYGRRPDLQEDFHANGLGKAGGPWWNSSLLDWCYWHGCREEATLREMSFSSIFEVIPTEKCP